MRKSRSKLIAEKKDPLAMMKVLSQQAAAAKAKSAATATRDIYRCAAGHPSHAPALTHERCIMHDR